MFFFFCKIVFAEDWPMRVVGLADGLAIIEENGVQQVLGVGQKSKQGIQLIKANAKRALFQWKGVKKELSLSDVSSVSINNETVHNQPSPKKGHKLHLFRQKDGMFRTKGFINGVGVSFLVDTGATSIAMNHTAAQKARINFRAKGKKILVETASGVVEGYRVNLKKVKVGLIELLNVDATVLIGQQPRHVLLGQSFLSRVNMQQTGNKLTISAY